MDKFNSRDIMNVRRRVNAARRHWCFTLNNPSNYCPGAPEFITHVSNNTGGRLRYMVFQEEKASGHLHYQGYMEYSQMVTMKWVHTALFGAAHVEPRHGTRDQARDYCMKLDSRASGPFEFGRWLLKQGKRNDLLEVADMVIAGAAIVDIAHEYPIQYIRYHKGINKLMALHQEVRTTAPQIILCFGKTGTGKTKWAHDSYPDLYKKPCDTRWFDTYAAHKELLLDDFAGAKSKMSLTYLLQLLDRYPLLVEVKGDYVSLQATTIVITTNLHPKSWYNYTKREEQFNALARRFHKVLHFSCFGEPPKAVSKDTFFQGWWEDCPNDQYLIPETQELKSEESQEPVVIPETQPAVIDLTDSSDDDSVSMEF